MFEYITLSLTSMKRVLLFSMALLLVGFLIVPASRAEDATRKDLPEGAFARLSEGFIGGKDPRCVSATLSAFICAGNGGMAYSPDGARLAMASLVGIRLYDAHARTEGTLLLGHKDWVSSVSFSPDGSTLASGGYDGTIRLWDVASGQQKKSLKGDRAGVFSVSFSPDGSTLASGGFDGMILLWDVP